jgi:hypothetical protein
MKKTIPFIAALKKKSRNKFNQGGEKLKKKTPLKEIKKT